MKTLKESILKSVKAGKHSIEKMITTSDYALGHIKRAHVSVDYLKDVLAQVVAFHPEIVKADLGYNIFFHTPEIYWLLYIDGFEKSLCSLVYYPEKNHRWEVDARIWESDPGYNIVKNIRKTLTKVLNRH